MLSNKVLFLALLFFLCSVTAAGADTPPPEEGTTSQQTNGSPPVTKDEGVNFFKSIWNSLTDEAHLKAGYGFVVWKMVLKRSSDGATATMVQRDDNAIFLSYGSKPSFFKDSKFGYMFSVGYVNFDMKNQEVPGDQFASLGTELEGQLVYAVPTLYYQWGEHRHKGTFVRLGLGVGVGAAQYSGTVRMSTGEVVYTHNRSYQLRLAVSNFLEARWRQFGISFSYAAPRLYGDGYDIRAQGVSANIGYVIYF